MSATDNIAAEARPSFWKSVGKWLDEAAAEAAERERNHLGRRIRELRKEKRLSGGELAAAVGISRNHIFCIERGDTHGPSAHVVMRLAEVLDTTMNDLLGVVTEDRGDPADEAFYRHYLTCDENVRARIRAVANVLMGGL